MDVKLEQSWKSLLKDELESNYFKEIVKFVKDEYVQFTIYPKARDIFRAFELCTFYDTKVVIIGQDPYHGKGQANGLCFAVNETVSPPPSLQNIFKEARRDIEVLSTDVSLGRWARQGVLLLNNVLTVRAGLPNSHKDCGWERFTSAAISALSSKKENLVFLLWGSHAKKKADIIDQTKHSVLMTSHPSPFSVNMGFAGCSHFSKTNSYLKNHGIQEINW